MLMRAARLLSLGRTFNLLLHITPVAGAHLVTLPQFSGSLLDVPSAPYVTTTV